MIAEKRKLSFLFFTLLKRARARVASKQTSWAAVVVKVGADEVDC